MNEHQDNQENPEFEDDISSKNGAERPQEAGDLGQGEASLEFPIKDSSKISQSGESEGLSSENSQISPDDKPEESVISGSNTKKDILSSDNQEFVHNQDAKDNLDTCDEIVIPKSANEEKNLIPPSYKYDDIILDSTMSDDEMEAMINDALFADHEKSRTDESDLCEEDILTEEERVIWEENKTFRSVNDVYENSDKIHPDELNQAPFKSRFNSWIRTVALLIVLIFVPEQVSWAFNYNPLVLWGNQFGVTGTGAMNNIPQGPLSNHVAGSVEHLLSQLNGKPNQPFHLQLPEIHEDQSENQKKETPSIVVQPRALMTPEKVEQIKQWVFSPDIHPLNCGVYSLHNILAQNDIDVSLPELSVSTLLVDLIYGIVKPGDSKLKTSLFSIHKIAKGYGLNYRAARMLPDETLKLKTPFVSVFQDEHFVVVNMVEGETIYYTDYDQAKSITKQEYLDKATGYIFAPNLESQKEKVAFEFISDNLSTFVWGAQWPDDTDQLPGLMGKDDWTRLWVVSGIQIALLFLPVLKDLAGGKSLADAWKAFNFAKAFINFSFAYNTARLAQNFSTACLMKGGCSATGAMILATAVSVAMSTVGSAITGQGLLNVGKNASTLTRVMVTLPAKFATALAGAYIEREVRIKVSHWMNECSAGGFCETLKGNDVLREGFIGLVSGAINGLTLDALDQTFFMNGNVRANTGGFWGNLWRAVQMGFMKNVVFDLVTFFIQYGGEKGFGFSPHTFMYRILKFSSDGITSYFIGALLDGSFDAIVNYWIFDENKRDLNANATDIKTQETLAEGQDAMRALGEMAVAKKNKDTDAYNAAERDYLEALEKLDPENENDDDTNKLKSELNAIYVGLRDSKQEAGSGKLICGNNSQACQKLADRVSNLSPEKLEELKDLAKTGNVFLLAALLSEDSENKNSLLESLNKIFGGALNREDIEILAYSFSQALAKAKDKYNQKIALLESKPEEDLTPNEKDELNALKTVIAILSGTADESGEYRAIINKLASNEISKEQAAEMLLGVVEKAMLSIDGEDVQDVFVGILLESFQNTRGTLALQNIFSKVIFARYWSKHDEMDRQGLNEVILSATSERNIEQFKVFAEAARNVRNQDSYRAHQEKRKDGEGPKRGSREESEEIEEEAVYLMKKYYGDSGAYMEAAKAELEARRQNGKENIPEPGSLSYTEMLLGVAGKIAKESFLAQAAEAYATMVAEEKNPLLAQLANGEISIEEVMADPDKKSQLHKSVLDVLLNSKGDLKGSWFRGLILSMVIGVKKEQILSGDKVTLSDGTIVQLIADSILDNKDNYLRNSDASEKNIANAILNTESDRETKGGLDAAILVFLDIVAQDITVQKIQEAMEQADPNSEEYAKLKESLAQGEQYEEQKSGVFKLLLAALDTGSPQNSEALTMLSNYLAREQAADMFAVSVKVTIGDINEKSLNEALEGLLKESLGLSQQDMQKIVLAAERRAELKKSNLSEEDQKKTLRAYLETLGFDGDGEFVLKEERMLGHFKSVVAELSLKNDKEVYGEGDGKEKSKYYNKDEGRWMTKEEIVSNGLISSQDAWGGFLDQINTRKLNLKNEKIRHAFGDRFKSMTGEEKNKFAQRLVDLGIAANLEEANENIEEKFIDVALAEFFLEQNGVHKGQKGYNDFVAQQYKTRVTDNENVDLQVELNRNYLSNGENTGDLIAVLRAEIESTTEGDAEGLEGQAKNLTPEERQKRDDILAKAIVEKINEIDNMSAKEVSRLANKVAVRQMAKIRTEKMNKEFSLAGMFKKTIGVKGLVQVGLAVGFDELERRIMGPDEPREGTDRLNDVNKQSRRKREKLIMVRLGEMFASGFIEFASAYVTDKVDGKDYRVDGTEIETVKIQIQGEEVELSEDSPLIRKAKAVYYNEYVKLRTKGDEDGNVLTPGDAHIKALQKKEEAMGADSLSKLALAEIETLKTQKNLDFNQAKEAWTEEQKPKQNRASSRWWSLLNPIEYAVQKAQNLTALGGRGLVDANGEFQGFHRNGRYFQAANAYDRMILDLTSWNPRNVADLIIQEQTIANRQEQEIDIMRRNGLSTVGAVSSKAELRRQVKENFINSYDGGFGQYYAFVTDFVSGEIKRDLVSPNSPILRSVEYIATGIAGKDSSFIQNTWKDMGFAARYTGRMVMGEKYLSLAMQESFAPGLFGSQDVIVGDLLGFGGDGRGRQGVYVQNKTTKELSIDFSRLSEFKKERLGMRLAELGFRNQKDSFISAGIQDHLEFFPEQGVYVAIKYQDGDDTKERLGKAYVKNGRLSYYDIEEGRMVELDKEDRKRVVDIRGLKHVDALGMYKEETAEARVMDTTAEQYAALNNKRNEANKDDAKAFITARKGERAATEEAVGNYAQLRTILEFGAAENSLRGMLNSKDENVRQKALNLIAAQYGGTSAEISELTDFQEQFVIIRGVNGEGQVKKVLGIAVGETADALAANIEEGNPLNIDVSMDDVDNYIAKNANVRSWMDTRYRKVLQTEGDLEDLMVQSPQQFKAYVEMFLEGSGYEGQLGQDVSRLEFVPNTDTGDAAIVYTAADGQQKVLTANEVIKQIASAEGEIAAKKQLLAAFEAKGGKVLAQDQPAELSSNVKGQSELAAAALPKDPSQMVLAVLENEEENQSPLRTKAGFEFNKSQLAKSSVDSNDILIGNPYYAKNPGTLSNTRKEVATDGVQEALPPRVPPIGETLSRAATLPAEVETQPVTPQQASLAPQDKQPQGADPEAAGNFNGSNLPEGQQR
ncbi:MAG: hypothetical protein KC713_00530, partial [Candidatus Omnitrophica bacterium]|nr:hypothetical protein [Candidatus Omnitrophota bacterium]